MNKEEKDLLLKDLCARLSYETIYANIIWEDGIVRDKIFINTGVISDLICDKIKSIKPYLRPMSSMTEEEKEELRLEHEKDERLFLECINKSKQGDNSMRGKVITHFASDWCNKNHFDYRGLIEKGLALEALEGMYKN